MSLVALAAALRAAAETLEAHLEGAPAEAAPTPAPAPTKRGRKTQSTEQAPPVVAPAAAPVTALAPAVPETSAAAPPVVPPTPPTPPAPPVAPAPSPEPPDAALVRKASDAISLLANEFDRDAAVGILAKRVIGTTADGKPIPAKKLSQLPFLKDTWQAVLDELEEAIEKARAKAAQVSLV